jgi:predicted PurR-regulated permease PerM
MIQNLFTSQNILFSILAIIVLSVVIQTKEVLLLFFAAYVIACALDPLVVKFENKKIARGPASAIVVLGAMLGVLGLFTPIVFVIVREIKSFIRVFPEKLADVSQFVRQFNFMGYNFEDLQVLLNSSSGFLHDFFGRSLDFTLGVVQFVVIVIAMLMIVYYILADKTYIKTKFIEFFPSELKEKASSISVAISTQLGNYVRVQLISMASVGIMTAMAVACLGVDYSILLGLITGVLDIIPILGPIIALAIILLTAYPITIVKTVLIIGLFLLVQNLSNYIVRPLLFGKLMSVHPLIIFLSLFLAQKFLGFWGVVLSPALAASICVLIDELYLKEINEDQTAV